MTSLELARGPVGRRLEMGIAVPSAPASAHDQFIAGRLQVPQHMAAVAIANDRPRRYLDDQVVAAAPEAVGTLPVFAACRLPVALVREVGQVRMTFGSAEDHAAAMPAVAAIGAASRRVLLTPKAEAAIAPSPSLHENRDPIDEHGALPMQADQPFADAGAGAGANGTTLMRRPS